MWVKNVFPGKGLEVDDQTSAFCEALHTKPSDASPKMSLGFIQAIKRQRPIRGRQARMKPFGLVWTKWVRALVLLTFVTNALTNWVHKERVQF